MVRLKQLELSLFGHFSGKVLDFGTVARHEHDFHVIYGPNEAGKTTVMEGYLRLLYGFSAREEYDFVHARKNLLVKGVLQINNKYFELQRTAKKNQSLLNAQGKAMPEGFMSQQLGRLSIEECRKLFCIDDDTIERGGEEIVNSQGEVGNLLFSAAAGISDLWSVLDTVRTQADSLYRKNAIKTRLAQLKSQYTSLDKRIHTLDVSAAEMQRLSQAREMAINIEQEAMQQRRALQVRFARINNQLQALPLASEFDTLTALLNTTAHYPEHLDVSASEVQQLQIQQQLAEADVQRLQAEKQALTAQLDTLVVNPEHLGLEKELSDLDGVRTAYAHAVAELASRQQQLDVIESDMRLKIRERFHVAFEIDDMVVDADVISRLKAMLEQCNALRTQLETEHDALTALRIRIDEASGSLDTLLHASPEGEGLSDILERFDASVLAARYDSATAAIEQAEENRREALAALSIKGHAFTELPDCTMDEEEAVELLERWQLFDSRLLSTTAALKDKRLELDSALNELARLESDAGLIGEEKISAVRQERDRLWQSHSRLLSADSARSFEAAMRRVDKVLAHKMATVRERTQVSELKGRITDVTLHVARIEDDLVELKAEQTAVETQLNGVLQAAGMTETAPPKRIVSWVRCVDSAVTACRQLQQEQQKYQATIDQAEQLRVALAPYIPMQRDSSLSALFARARLISQSYSDYAEQVRSMRENIKNLQDKQSLEQVRIDRIRAALQQRQGEWEALVQQHLPGGIDLIELENSLDVLNVLRESHVQRMALRTDIQRMRHDQVSYKARIDALIKRYQPGDRIHGDRVHGDRVHGDRLHGDSTQGDASVDPFVNERRLYSLWRTATEQSRQRTELQEKLRCTEQALTEAKRSETDVLTRSSVMQRLFHAEIDCDDLQQLHDAVVKSHQVIKARTRRAELQRTLCETLAVSTTDGVRSELEGIDAEALQVERAELEAQMEASDLACTKAIETRARAEQDLLALTGDTEVAQLIEQRTTIELEMEETVQTYLRLHFGHHLAEQAIRCYRDRHRSDMLKATEQAFARLTSNRYARLQTQAHGAGEVLLAIDQAGRSKRADEMSKGTRFQLYLALRVAAYTQLARQGTCLPFMCDDIFETFDEDRTRSACQLLHDMGLHGQSVYLTHHQHVVDIAQDVCGEQVCVHYL